MANYSSLSLFNVPEPLLRPSLTQADAVTGEEPELSLWLFACTESAVSATLTLAASLVPVSISFSGLKIFSQSTNILALF